VRVGIIRFTRLFQNKNKWEIHFTVAPKYRGKGYSKPMLSKALEWFRQVSPHQVVYAQVKAQNLKSLKALKSVGFTKDKKLKTPRTLIRLRLLDQN
jgi:RimJ/RimL family protein N-acetyltransferase